MKIAFLLPSEGNIPSGGNKVIYEYANGLAARGHEVTLLHFAAAEPRLSTRTWKGKIRPMRYIGLALKGKWRPDNWFKLHPAVKVVLAPTPIRWFMPDADAYVAGWWSTAERLAELKGLPGRKLYLLQHLETWAAPEEDVMATWTAPLEKIVIARWLGQIAEELGETAEYIPNGLDFSKFGCDIAPDEREAKRVAMLYNDGVSWKGSADGLEALALLKDRYPDLEAELFGVQERPVDLPAWIVYHQQPKQDELRRIYNRAAIFIAPSHSEGWGLPPCEAMISGAAVVATDIGGHREFAVDGENALLVPAMNPAALAEAIGRLIEDKSLRVRIATTGNEQIQRFTWDAAVDAFEQFLTRRPNSAEASAVAAHRS